MKVVNIVFVLLPDFRCPFFFLAIKNAYDFVVVISVVFVYCRYKSFDASFVDT